MPEPVRTTKRVVARYLITNLDGQWWGKAYDVGSSRFTEADVLGGEKSLIEVQTICRERVNQSYFQKKLKN